MQSWPQTQNISILRKVELRELKCNKVIELNLNRLKLINLERRREHFFMPPLIDSHLSGNESTYSDVENNQA